MDPSTTILKGISATTDYLQQNVFSKGPAGLLFLCKDDIRSPNLYSHLPMLTFLSHPETILLTLPKGSKGQLKELFIPIDWQATCVYVQGTTEEYERFYKVIMELQKPVQLPGVSRSLLESQAHSRAIAFVPAQIKTVQTSAPIGKKGANKKAKNEKECATDKDNKTVNMDVNA